jgi:hypothetical protein
MARKDPENRLTHVGDIDASPQVGLDRHAARHDHEAFGQR